MAEFQYGFTVNLACSYEKCTNAGRYLDDQGRVCCATCPVTHGNDSIRLADVPALLAWTRRMQIELRYASVATAGGKYEEAYVKLGEIIGKHPNARRA